MSLPTVLRQYYKFSESVLSVLLFYRSGAELISDQRYLILLINDSLSLKFISIYCLYNDASNSSDCRASYDRFFGECELYVYGRKRCLPNLRHYLGIYVDKLGKPRKASE